MLSKQWFVCFVLSFDIKYINYISSHTLDFYERKYKVLSIKSIKVRERTTVTKQKVSKNYKQHTYRSITTTKTTTTKQPLYFIIFEEDISRRKIK